MKSKHPGRVSRVNPYVHARARLWDIYRKCPAYPALPCRKPTAALGIQASDAVAALGEFQLAMIAKADAETCFIEAANFIGDSQRLIMKIQVQLAEEVFTRPSPDSLPFPAITDDSKDGLQLSDLDYASRHTPLPPGPSPAIPCHAPTPGQRNLFR